MTKKTFGDVAKKFLSTPEEDAQKAETQEAPPPKNAVENTKPPAGYKLDPRCVEIKSKRVQLVLQPSVYERAKEKAWREHLSVNEYIHQLIEKDTGSGDIEKKTLNTPKAGE